MEHDVAGVRVFRLGILALACVLGITAGEIVVVLAMLGPEEVLENVPGKGSGDVADVDCL